MLLENVASDVQLIFEFEEVVGLTIEDNSGEAIFAGDGSYPPAKSIIESRASPTRRHPSRKHSDHGSFNHRRLAGENCSRTKWVKVIPIFMIFGIAGLIQPAINTTGSLLITHGTGEMFRWKPYVLDFYLLYSRPNWYERHDFDISGVRVPIRTRESHGDDWILSDGCRGVHAETRASECLSSGIRKL
jgi:hypothetical protein